MKVDCRLGVVRHRRAHPFLAITFIITRNHCKVKLLISPQKPGLPPCTEEHWKCRSKAAAYAVASRLLSRTGAFRFSLLVVIASENIARESSCSGDAIDPCSFPLHLPRVFCFAAATVAQQQAPVRFRTRFWVITMVYDSSLVLCGHRQSFHL